jgi:hypothetical protein
MDEKQKETIVTIAVIHFIFMFLYYHVRVIIIQ